MWMKGIGLGAISGILGGLIAILLNQITGVFVFESSLASNLVTFSIGGAVFGVVTGGFMALIGDRLPFRSFVLRGVVVSGGIWMLLRFSGYLMAANEPERYHSDNAQTLQGFTLAIILGAILGTLWGSKFGKANQSGV